MGCLSVNNLRNATRALIEVAGKQKAINLSVTGLTVLTGSHPVVAIDISLSDELRELQRNLIKAFRPLITQDANKSDLFDPPSVEPSVVAWINNFISEQSDGNFWPHITLGHGRPTADQQPFNFTASRIAICHLGNHCTCRRIFAEATLRD